MGWQVPSWQRWLKPKRLAILEACLIGLLAGIAAVLLKQGIGWLGGWRIYISNDLPTWLALPVIGMAGGFLSGFLVENFATEASGSGIPQVKAALSYVPIALNLRVAIVKVSSTILSLGSGLALGRQGPTVQIGAAIAGQVSQWIPNSPEYQRQLIAAGAAAGLAAGFNAPIAGVLFVIEELLHDVSSLTLGTAILASFIGATVSRLLTGQSLAQTIPQVQFTPQEIPFLLILGLAAGWLAALFNHGVLAAIQWNRQTFKIKLSWRIAIAGGLSGLAIAMLPIDFRDSTGLQLFLAMGQSDWQVTASAFAVRFILALIACSSEAPGGLFIPSLILGAALGSLVGNLEQSLLGTGTLSTYALSGMGAFFGAVAKVPITAFVIVFEITMDFNIILPLMITSVVAYLCAEKFAPGSLYTHLLELKGIYLKTDTGSEDIWNGMDAADVMQRDVEVLSDQMTIAEAMQTFGRSHHRGFPVISNQQHLVGIITQMDLVKVSERQLSNELAIAEIMTPKPISVSPEEGLSQVLYLLSYYKLSRLPVIDRHKLVGIITRSDILRAQAKRLRGVSSQTSKPSYLVYQQRGTATGRGKLLLPLHNLQTATYLIDIALAIASEHNYELECLHIIAIASHLPPSETSVDLSHSLALFKQAATAAKLKQVPLHTQVRVAHDTGQAILEVIGDRKTNLLIIGWAGNSSSPERIFGNTVDTVVRQADCDVMLVKFSDRLQNANPFNQEFRKPQVSFNRWLIPIAGGPNAEGAMQLLPSLLSLADNPEACLCQIFAPDTEENTPKKSGKPAKNLEKYADYLFKTKKFSAGVISVCSKSIADAIVDLANQERSDVILLGASRESMLQHIVQGNIPDAIARNSDKTIIIFKRATSQISN
ncbi:MAG: chloride channel protein [Oscillatoriales cyanobacterium CG2_30_44_21]|nr:MAG: chloride channel protein [Oscillatoriales cyanobacterium CG2_30_44_21]